ncbi:MAG: helix-turn-helix transcriptional regulator [Desulfitobacterium hafniense]
MIFGRKLRAARESAGLLLKDLAREMGWSVVYLSDIERGRRNPPSPDKIAQMANILGADYRTLVDLANQEKMRVELEIADKSQHITTAALMLARSWDGLTEEEAQEIIKVLSKREGRNG